jgi:cellobiose-specific phosphotransferase system component IIC
MHKLSTLKSRLGRRIAAVSLMALAAVMMALPAFAEPTATEQVQTEILAAFTNVQGIVLGIIAGFFALVLVGVAVRVGQKYTKRGGQNA